MNQSTLLFSMLFQYWFDGNLRRTTCCLLQLLAVCLDLRHLPLPKQSMPCVNKATPTTPSHLAHPLGLLPHPMNHRQAQSAGRQQGLACVRKGCSSWRLRQRATSRHELNKAPPWSCRCCCWEIKPHTALPRERERQEGTRPRGCGCV